MMVDEHDETAAEAEQTTVLLEEQRVLSRSEDPDPEECHTSLSRLPEAKGTLIPVVSYVHTTHEHQPVVTEGPPTVEAFPLSMRPEFLYASAHLPPGRSAGIHLQARSNFGVAIASFDNDSPLRGSHIHPGDHVIAINNLSCADVDLAGVEQLIAASTNSVSICVHNTKGDPRLVASSVQKRNIFDKVGITLKTTDGKVHINKVFDDGLLGKSLLMPHHRCMVINGVSCSHMDAQTASSIIAAARDRVTIVSKPPLRGQWQECYAMTIALCQHKKWWKRIVFGAGVAAGAAVTVGSFS